MHTRTQNSNLASSTKSPPVSFNYYSPKISASRLLSPRIVSFKPTEALGRNTDKTHSQLNRSLFDSKDVIVQGEVDMSLDCVTERKRDRNVRRVLCQSAIMDSQENGGNFTEKDIPHKQPLLIAT